MITLLVEFGGGLTFALALPNDRALLFRRLAKAIVEGARYFEPAYAAVAVRDTTTVVGKERRGAKDAVVLVDELPPPHPLFEIDGVDAHVGPSAFRFVLQVNHHYGPGGGDVHRMEKTTAWVPWSVFNDALGEDP